MPSNARRSIVVGMRRLAGILQTAERYRKPSLRFCAAEVRVQIPSTPLIKGLGKTLAGDAQHQDGDVVAGYLLLKIQSGAPYTTGDGRSVESNRGAQEGHEPLLAEEEVI
jgi:hypothetical protein